MHLATFALAATLTRSTLQALLLEEQHRLKQQLSGTTGHPAVLTGTEDSAMDSKAWLTAGPRFTAASQQQTLQSADMETEACTMGSSIEPAVSSRITSQQTNSHAVFGALMVPLMCANMAMR